jgi:hypothetical protein
MLSFRLGTAATAAAAAAQDTKNVKKNVSKTNK